MKASFITVLVIAPYCYYNRIKVCVESFCFLFDRFVGGAARMTGGAVVVLCSLV